MVQAVVYPDGRLVLQGQVFRAALGRTGVRTHKQEGDGATPVGLLPLRRVLYRLDRLPPPECAVPIEPISETDGWCDDPAHRDYNRYVRVPHEAHCEELWRHDGLYDVIGVLGWNDAPVEKGRGSAIFLHVARPDYAPTEGCIALAPPDLLRLLAAGVTELVVDGGAAASSRHGRA
ncbi:MAG TPA: L,D-transpeptidase family protein [Acetobacteraceae bacterium]|jgi:L,D-peptidoglycan transpeptidase YkuD (ErfK/YbiS/YcfS/YnhG family)|nr:L,D-transpeptidase family protein [Acetobacteraceae bacterium]